jgi:hypothetical protein
VDSGGRPGERWVNDWGVGRPCRPVERMTGSQAPRPGPGIKYYDLVYLFEHISRFYWIYHAVIHMVVQRGADFPSTPGHWPGVKNVSERQIQKWVKTMDCNSTSALEEMTCNKAIDLCLFVAQGILYHCFKGSSISCEVGQRKPAARNSDEMKTRRGRQVRREDRDQSRSSHIFLLYRCSSLSCRSVVGLYDSMERLAKLGKPDRPTRILAEGWMAPAGRQNPTRSGFTCLNNSRESLNYSVESLNKSGESLSLHAKHCIYFQKIREFNLELSNEKT